jgi:hypothetical protein
MADAGETGADQELQVQGRLSDAPSSNVSGPGSMTFTAQANPTPRPRPPGAHPAKLALLGQLATLGVRLASRRASLTRNPA